MATGEQEFLLLFQQINELATKYGSDEDVTTLLDAFDWKITPVSNPDGFVHTHTSVIYIFIETIKCF